MSEITVREIIKNAITELGGKAANNQIFDWIEKNFPGTLKSTISAHLLSLSVNSPTRIYSGRNKKPRSFNPEYDFLFKLNRNEYELYDQKKHGNYELIESNGKTVISKDGVPIKSDTPTLLNFLKKNQMFRNYQAILIKTLLEEGEDNNFSSSKTKIFEKIQELNFENHFNKSVLKAPSDALKNCVNWDDENYYLKPEFFPGDEIKECLKYCGKRIAQYHINDITNDDFVFWYMMPGRREDNFPFLDEFLKSNSIGVGWRDIGDVTNLTPDKIKEKFVDVYKTEKGLQSVERFLEIRPKDIIVLTKGQEKIVDFGIVTGTYYWKLKPSPSYPHRKNIVWLNQESISANDLPPKLLSGFAATVGKLESKRQLMIEVLLGKDIMAAIKAHSCFILTSNSGSKFADIVGKEYEYPKGQANSKSLISGSKFIIQSKIDGKNYFVGYGKIDSIQKGKGTNEKDKPMQIAKFANYEKFDPPKLRTDEINTLMKSQKSYGGRAPSILPITRPLFTKITGQDFKDPDKVTNMSDVQEIIDVFKKKKNVILYGPPGTGKTYTTTNVKEWYENNYHDPDSKKALLFSTDEGDKKIEKFKKFIAENGKILWGVGWYPTQLTKSDYPITGYIKLKGKVIAIANIIQITRSEDTSKHDESLAAGGGGEPSYLHMDNLKLCTPFAFEKLSVFGKPNTEPNLQRFSYVGLLPENVKFVTFHPSYSYEDFVEGIRPVVTDSHNLEKTNNDKEKTSNNKITYALEDGIFKKICNDAKSDPDNKYLLIIDEINRGNVSKILGELITLVEDDKRESFPLHLAYSKKPFTVPKNLYILGTMNTADKSLIQIDTALRRRFAFVELPPNYDLPELQFKIDVKINDETVKKSLKELLEKLNEILREKQLRDKQIGHSYFLKIKKIEDLQFVFQYEIIPLLQDYFYDNYEKLADVLGAKLISKTKMSVNKDVINDPEKFSSALGQIFSKQ